MFAHLADRLRDERRRIAERAADVAEEIRRAAPTVAKNADEPTA